MAQEEDDRSMIHPSNKQERRRSQRIPQSMPLFVKEVDAPFVHGGNARTIEVSRHGCVIHALRPYPCGTELQLDALYGNRTCRTLRSGWIGNALYDVDHRARAQETRKLLVDRVAVDRLSQDRGTLMERAPLAQSEHGTGQESQTSLLLR